MISDADQKLMKNNTDMIERIRDLANKTIQVTSLIKIAKL